MIKISDESILIQIIWLRYLLASSDNSVKFCVYVCRNITLHHECRCRIGKSHPKFLSGTRLDESLIKIPTQRVIFTYPT